MVKKAISQLLLVGKTSFQAEDKVRERRADANIRHIGLKTHYHLALLKSQMKVYPELRLE